jgi:hypothetical protein
MIIPDPSNISADERFEVSGLVGVSGEGERLTLLNGVLLPETGTLLSTPDEFVFLG